MEPISAALLIIVGLAGVVGGAGGAVLVGGDRRKETVTTLDDRAAVADAETEQVYSMERVLADVCSRTDPAGVELCDILSCRAQAREDGGGTAQVDCSAVSNVAASKRAHAYCEGYASQLGDAGPAAMVACLGWFAQRK